MRLFPSIASSNCLAYGRELERIGAWQELHIDIEDGNFTPNIITLINSSTCLPRYMYKDDCIGFFFLAKFINSVEYIARKMQTSLCRVSNKVY